MRWLTGTAIVLALLLAGPAYMALSGELEFGGRWQDADRSSTGLAPDPAETPDAVVQVYAARAFDWRGVFGVHTWIATREHEAPQYRVYEVTRWDLSRLYSTTTTPDRTWFNNEPELLFELRGAQAEPIVARIMETARAYPDASDYRVWPGPNSNTFTAWIVRATPGLEVELPPTAVGKDYLPGGWLARTPSDTGYQLSAGGYLGLTLARAEGLEINILGVIVGIDPGDRAIKLPGVGRIGLQGRGPAG